MVLKGDANGREMTHQTQLGSVLMYTFACFCGTGDDVCMKKQSVKYLFRNACWQQVHIDCHVSNTVED